MNRTLQEKIDHILYDLQYTPNTTKDWAEKNINEAIQELREEIQSMYLQVEINHTIPLAQAVTVRAIFAYRNVLALIGEKK